MSAVHASGLVKRYETTCALDGVDLELQEGEVRGLLGPTGAGKPTVLRLLFGLMSLDAGSIELLDRPLVAPDSVAPLGDGGDSRGREDLALRDRRPRLGGDVVRLVVGAHGLVEEIGVQLDLIHRRWAPHIRGASGLGEPEIEAGRSGFVLFTPGLPVPARITGKRAERWWDWRVGPVHVRHIVEAQAEGCRAGVELRAAAPAGFCPGDSRGACW